MANNEKKTTKKKSAASKKTDTKKIAEESKKVESKKIVSKNKKVETKKKTAKPVEKKTVKKTTTKTTTKKETKPTEKKEAKKKTVTKTTTKKEIKPTEKKETIKKKVEPKVVEVKPVEPKVVEESNVIEEVKTDDIKIISKKLIQYFIILVVVILIFFIVLVIKKNNNSEEIQFVDIDLKKYLSLYEENSGLEYIYITNDSCIKCDDYEVNLKKIENEFKIKIKKLDISNFSDKDLKDIEDSNSFILDVKDVPILTAVKEKTFISAINGIKEYSAIKNFISYSINPSNNSFEKISVDKYLSLLKSKDSILIYIGTSSDSACEKFSVILEKVSSSKGIKVYYLNTDDIVTDSNIKKLTESSEIFSEDWFVPTIVIVKNGGIKDYRMYAMSEEMLIQFLNRNNM